MKKNKFSEFFNKKVARSYKDFKITVSIKKQFLTSIKILVFHRSRMSNLLLHVVLSFV